MPKYEYLAKGRDGNQARGFIEASGEAEGRVRLQAQGLIALRLTLVKQNQIFKFSGRVKPKELQIFTRQLATLLASGIPILQSLEALSRGGADGPLKRTINQIVASLSEGKRLGQAMAEHPRVFDKFYCNMIVAAEESGQLDLILNRLATYIEKAGKIAGKIKSAMLYPAIVLFVASGVVTLILIFVIPKFQELFEQAGQKLPALTQFVIDASHFLQKWWWAVGLALFGVYLGFKAYYDTPEGRKVVDKFLLDAPIFGEILKKGGMAKFTRTLSTLLSSGVGILEGLDIATKTVGNVILEESFARAKDSISEGKSFVAPLAKEKYIPPMVIQMIGVGEQTGNLDEMLAKVADFYEDEVDNAVGALTSVIEPVLMVVLGGIIAVLVLAMYLPIFTMAGAVGG